MKLIHAGRWFIGVGNSERFAYAGISRVRTLDGKPLGWNLMLDSRRFNRCATLRIRIDRSVGRYHW